MAIIKVPSNVTSMTFTTSGVKVPAAGLVSGITALEANAFAVTGIGARGVNYGPARLCQAAANGNLTIEVPSLITSITIGGVVYAVGGAVTPTGKKLTNPVPAEVGTAFLRENFSLVQG